MPFNNRTYAIIDTASYEAALSQSGQSVEVLMSKVLESSRDTIRYSVDRTSFIVKSDKAANIAWLRGFAQSHGVIYATFDHEEILDEILKTEWQPLDDTTGTFNALPVIG